MRPWLVLAVLAAMVAPAATQARRPARRPAPRLPKLETIAPELVCPETLGAGVTTQTTYCDVLTGRDPAQGILIALPPHVGSATLTFDLHNRQTYSEEQVKAHRAFARYTATIGVLTMDNTLISRAVVQSEFRTAADLVERISGGAGPRGLKAVAPTGTEPITIEIPAGVEDQVSILGEKLMVEHRDPADNATYSQPGRPIADISHVMLSYRPAPPPRKPARGRR
jgi:hypothetical protein